MDGGKGTSFMYGHIDVCSSTRNCRANRNLAHNVDSKALISDYLISHSVLYLVSRAINRATLGWTRVQAVTGAPSISETLATEL